jgi:hypothetical protein
MIVDKRFSKEIEQYFHLKIRFLRPRYSMDNFADLIKDVKDADILRQHRGIIGIRKIVSINKSLCIDAMIEAGLMPQMI